MNMEIIIMPMASSTHICQLVGGNCQDLMVMLAFCKHFVFLMDICIFKHADSFEIRRFFFLTTLTLFMQIKYDIIKAYMYKVLFRL